MRLSPQLIADEYAPGYQLSCPLFITCAQPSFSHELRHHGVDSVLAAPLLLPDMQTSHFFCGMASLHVFHVFIVLFPLLPCCFPLLCFNSIVCMGVQV